MARSYHLRAAFVGAALLLAAGAVAAQPPPRPPRGPAPALRVFLDCGYMCDFDFIRTEVAGVDWVRDRTVADVHVLVTTQQTGAGGVEFTIAFLGLKRLVGMGDTLVDAASPTATDDEARRELAQVLKVGLARFVARASGFGRVTISFPRDSTGTDTARAQKDPWNYWVFQAQANGFGNGQSSTSYLNVFGNATANRVTEAWKTTFSLRESYSQNKYQLTDSSTFTNIQRNYSLSGLQVKSISSHWSVGATAELSASAYLNERRVIRAAPAIEYDLFPYKESTRRQLRLQYAIGVSHYAYFDTTIYLKIQETIPTQSVGVAASAVQPWGSVNVSAQGRSFLNDPSKRSAELYGNINVRIVGGLSVNLGGDVSSIRDQVYLASGGVTDQQILVSQRQLATSYQYFMNFGLSYTFGSIFNNVVNPRFGGGSIYY